MAQHTVVTTETAHYAKTVEYEEDGHCSYMRLTTNLPEDENLIVKMLGYEECRAEKEARGHTFEHHTLHFIMDGCGYFDGIRLTKQDGFMVKRNYFAEYYPDRENAWTYAWINFDGRLADLLLETAALAGNKCIFSVQDNHRMTEIIRKAINYDYAGMNVAGRLKAFLLEIFACMFTDLPDAFFAEGTHSVMEKRVKEGIAFIGEHYREKNCIAALAEQEKVDSHYLAGLFKKYSDHSPQAHVIRLRIEESKRLLRMTALTVGEVAASVGYEDVLQFSRIFRKHTGVSPSAYRKGTRDMMRQYE